MKKVFTWKMQDILASTGGRLLFGSRDAVFAQVGIDSRTIGKDWLFVAVKGQRFDGHDFAAKAVEKGASGILIKESAAAAMPWREWEKAGVSGIGVPDTIKALGDLARFRRRSSGVKLVAVTGSCGKTTTRRMAASVLSEKFVVCETKGNENNELGVPLTLFSLEHRHSAAVVELGMNHPGEIGYLAGMCLPDIGVITNIGPAHLEGVGGLNDVAEAKAELMEYLGPEKTVILNADDAFFQSLASRAECRVVSFGVSEKADIRGTDLSAGLWGVDFLLNAPSGSARIHLNAHGRFMIKNALAAAAVGWALGLEPEEIARGLARFIPCSGRMRIFKSKKGYFVIDDTYNANPASMTEAIDTLVELSGSGRRILVAGDMNELGEAAPAFHNDIGRLAAGAGMSRIYLTGEMAAYTARGAAEAGADDSAIFVGTKKEIITDLSLYVEKGDWILAKGSRLAAMEDIVEGLLKDGAVSLFEGE